MTKPKEIRWTEGPWGDFDDLMCKYSDGDELEYGYRHSFGWTLTPQALRHTLSVLEFEARRTARDYEDDAPERVDEVKADIELIKRLRKMV